ncbi:MAG: diguanylate cyclase [Rubrivivax sp.]|nr:MAG: diguanylate cyclase [Rubrivivax sp.]
MPTGSAPDDLQSVSQAAHDTHEPPEPGSLEDVIQRGHRWLRFPATLEAQFQADTLESRRKLLIFCGLLGILSIYLGTANIAELNPDIAAMALRVAHYNLLACGVGLAVLLPIPKRWRRTWQAEGVTALIALGTCAGLINGCVFSRADSTFTHSAVMVSVVMYTCIAARQRFAWSLGCAVLSFLGYVTFVKGFTPQQELIVAANIKLMALSFAFALVANYTFEYRERRHWLLRQLEEQRRGALVETSARLHRLSIQDPLTGLLNRRQFDTDLPLAWSKAAGAGQPLAMLMVDVDFFKRYNDTHGHPAGDACLIRVGQELTKVAQAHGGIATRLGGEEFGLLLPDRTLAQAMRAGTSLCEGLRAARIEHRASAAAPHITVSIGAAQVWPAQGGKPQTLAKLADQALYQAKASGRDRVCAASAHDIANEGQLAPLQTGNADVNGATDQGPPTTSLPVSCHAQTLEGKFRWLRFPADQENAYRNHDATLRRKHLVLMALLGLVIYNFYIMSSRAMFPDVRASALTAQLGLSACLLILTVVIYKLTVLQIWLREAVFSLGISAAAVLTVWVLSQSQHLSALSFSVCLALIPMFSGVGARQPFWFTCVPAVVTCLAAMLLLKPAGALHTLVFNDSILMIVNNTVFSLILAYTLEHGARKEWLLSHIERLQRQALVSATQRLHELSTQDPLTGISNRRQFEDDFERIWTQGLQEHWPVALLIIDVDFFKRYNDAYGHPAGDRCLQQVAAVLSQTGQDCKGFTARVGGEEFCMLLPGATADTALQVGERVCTAMRKASVEHSHSKVADHVTVSVGVASLLPAQSTDRRVLLAAADDALYQAKMAGRNRVAAQCRPIRPAQPAVMPMNTSPVM